MLMRFLGALVPLSIIANNLTGGPQGWSLCARFYAHRLDGSQASKLIVKAIDRMFWFDPQHCRRAYLTREPKDG